MAIPIDNRRRQVVPRWHRSETAAARGELSPLRERGETPSQRDLDLLSERHADWETSRTLAHASDFAGTALVIGRADDAREAASFILESDRASDAARTLARRVLDPGGSPSQADEPTLEVTDPKVTHARIRRLRAAIRQGPRNPLAWSDLAYEYTLVGLIEKARQAMEVALRLAPDSRFLIRSATRLLVHGDEADRALRLLRDAPGAAEDPWLAAAEIAVSALTDRTPRLVRAGRKLLLGDLSNRQTTELASGLGTLECAAGKTRLGKQLLQRSLMDPSENAVAQAEWASRQMGLGLGDDVARHLQVPGSFEARARSSLRSGDFAAALDAGKQWLQDQAFASDPASFGSYVAAVAMEDYEETKRIAEFGLVANPSAWLLLNNLAFAEANLGNLPAALAILSRAPRDPSDRVRSAVLSATDGLLLFRTHNLAEGRARYQATIDYFKKVGYWQGAALAAIFLAREELLASELSTARERLADARKLVKHTNAQEVATLLAHVEDQLVRTAPEE